MKQRINMIQKNICIHTHTQLNILVAHQKLAQYCKWTILHWGGFPSGSAVKNLPTIQETQVQSLDWEDSLGEGIQSSCLENPMDRGAWWVRVNRIAKSQTGLKQLSMHAYFIENKKNKRYPPPRVMKIKTKINKWELIKNFCTANKTTIKMKRLKRCTSSIIGTNLCIPVLL